MGNLVFECTDNSLDNQCGVHMPMTELGYIAWTLLDGFAQPKAIEIDEA